MKWMLIRLSSYSFYNKILTMLDICTLGDEVLRTKCEKITEFDHSLELLTDAMFDTLVEADGVGLAGPQIGVEKRLFVVDIPDEGIKKVFINPEIIETSVETGPYDEGCLSIPGLSHEVIRPLEVTVYAQDVKGKAFNVHAKGLYARVIQHENDHLDGKLYIDRLSEEEREKMIAKYNKRKQSKKKSRN